jgi:hypothetical protein
VEEGEVGWWVGRTEAGRVEGGGEREEKKGKATLRDANELEAEGGKAQGRGQSVPLCRVTLGWCPMRLAACVVDALAGATGFPRPFSRLPTSYREVPTTTREVRARSGGAVRGTRTPRSEA